LKHEHDIKKTHISINEIDDVRLNKLAKNPNYFGENNSKGRKLEYNFEYCLICDFRLLDNKPIMTTYILEKEFERFVIQAKNNKHTNSEQITLQHTDFEILELLIKRALEFGKLKESYKLKNK
jgi:hypothetical protein